MADDQDLELCGVLAGGGEHRQARAGLDGHPGADVTATVL